MRTIPQKYKTPKLVLVCFYQAYPPASGAASVTFNVAKHLSGRRWLIQLSNENRREQLDDTMMVVSLKDNCRSRLQKISALRSRLRRTVEEITDIEPDTVIFEGASWVVYFVLLHTLLLRRGITAKFVYHSHNVEYLLRKERYGWPITSLTRWAEKYLLIHCDIATAVSDVDAAQFESLYGVRPQLFPNAVDVARFDAVSDDAVQRIKEKYRLPGHTVLFMGLIDYKPNSEAIQFLIAEAFPLLLSICPQAKLVIIGGNVSYDAPWLINPGSIPSDDLPAFVKACTVCVAPIFSGSGTRLKILEYMAAARPVVCTRKGAEGLHVDDGTALLYADDAHEFAGRVALLLKDKERASRVGSHGYETVHAQYGWPVIIRDFMASPDRLRTAQSEVFK